MKGWQVLPDGAFGCRACDCHSYYAGMDDVNHWIPAFACLLQAGRNDDTGNRHGPTIFTIQRHSRLPASGE